MTHEVPDLGYAFDALEPHIDAKTMEIHHDKHHAGYVKKLNAALENYPELADKPVEELIADLDSVPEDIRTAVRNNGGGHTNHSFFWKLLKKDAGKPSEALMKAMNDDIGKDAHEKWAEMAMGVFGSGWIWVCLNKDKKLEIVTTANQDSPLSLGLTPIMGADLWEHAYYLKHQNKRDEYLKELGKVTNWEVANKLYEEAMA